jgi:hypothetical protein
LYVEVDLADKATVIHVGARCADTNDVTCRGNTAARIVAQSYIAAAGAAKERITAGVVSERMSYRFRSEYKPRAVLYLPVVRLKRALCPSAVFPPA